MEASSEAVSRYLESCLDTVSHNTAALRLSGIRAFYEFCRKTGIRDDDPTLDLSIRWENLEPRPPHSDDELGVLLGGCRNDRDRTMITVAYACGLRVAEVVGLRDKDIFEERGEIIVKGKGGRERRLWPEQGVFDALRPYMGRGGLWWTKDGKPLSVKRAQRNMEEIARRAGVHAHWHRLRTTFANRALEAGIPLEDLQRLMGHSSAETTRHYAGAYINRRALTGMRNLNLVGRLFE